MKALLPASAILLYLSSGLLIGLRLFGSDRQWRPARAMGLTVGWLAVGLHAAILYTMVVQDTGLNLAFFPTLSA